MITLKDLVTEQQISGRTDIEVIQNFFRLNDMEEDGIDLISELTKSKITKLKMKTYLAKEWICMLSSKYLYEKYPLDVADKLHLLELNYLVNGGELSEKLLQWAKNNISSIKEPQVYFRPLIDYLEERNITNNTNITYVWR